MLCHKHLSLVPMGLSDMQAITRIENTAHSHPWSEKLFLSNFGQRYSNHCLLLNDTVIGYFVASSVAGEVTLMNIAVAPAQQGKGAGLYLLHCLLTSARSKGEQEIWLEVRRSNQSAIHLYQKVGFVEVDIRRDYYPLENAKESANGREDALIMCCYL